LILSTFRHTILFSSIILVVDAPGSRIFQQEVDKTHGNMNVLLKVIIVHLGVNLLALNDYNGSLLIESYFF